MIRALFIDLDGTLVQTEPLKAMAYAHAVRTVLGLSAPDMRAFQAYWSVVGLIREKTSLYIMEHLGLEPVLLPLMAEYGVTTPSEVLTKLRNRCYDAAIADPQTVRRHRQPQTIALLDVARAADCRTALVTMSPKVEAEHILRVLKLDTAWDAVLTRNDVANVKPHPEVYLLASQRVGVPPEGCLAVEDSAAGVQAAVTAGMSVVALATEFTTAQLNDSPFVDKRWMVTPEGLVDAVRRRLEEDRVHVA